jgi:cytochrome d ubiquinol oxidase subunit II
MNLNTIWFVLVAVLFIGYFFLEGFDYGVGVLLPFVGRTDQERRAVLATIGPVWDANEVWLITAAGAIFAAFPNWYATLFSGFYLALAGLLAALIVRGVAFEFRSKDSHPRWRHLWDALVVIGSGIPPIVWGMSMANMLHGLPIDAHMNYVGTVFDLVNPFSIVGGLAALLLFVLHGALYLTLKTTDTLQERARAMAFRVGGAATGLYFLFVVMAYFYTPFPQRLGVDPGVVPVLAGLSMVSVRFLLQRRLYAWAFALNGAAIVLSVITVFSTLYPDLLLSTLNPHWSLTIYNAASNPYSLKVMTILAVAALPFVLAYQAWTYWVFRQRVTLKQTFHY